MPQIYGKASINTPGSEVGDGTFIALQADEFGALLARKEETFFAEQGCYYKACNATIDTGIAMGIQAAFSDTANVLFLMRNGSTSKKIIPHYIKLVCTAAGVTTTQGNIAIITDTANRYSTGGTDLTTSIVNANTSNASTSACDLLRYNCTALAAVNKRQIARSVLKTASGPCWTVGDEVVILFNDSHQVGSLAQANTGRYIANVGQVVLSGQNHSLLVHMWNKNNATTAPSWEFEIAWWER